MAEIIFLNHKINFTTLENKIWWKKIYGLF